MAGEQSDPALLTKAQQLRQLADAQLAQSNARPTTPDHGLTALREQSG